MTANFLGVSIHLRHTKLFYIFPSPPFLLLLLLIIIIIIKKKRRRSTGGVV